jgi:hypothetical protein
VITAFVEKSRKFEGVITVDVAAKQGAELDDSELAHPVARKAVLGDR